MRPMRRGRPAGVVCGHVVAHQAVTPSTGQPRARQRAALRANQSSTGFRWSKLTLVRVRRCQALHFAPSPALRGRPDGRTAL